VRGPRSGGEPLLTHTHTHLRSSGTSQTNLHVHSVNICKTKIRTTGCTNGENVHGSCAYTYRRKFALPWNHSVDRPHPPPSSYAAIFRGQADATRDWRILIKLEPDRLCDLEPTCHRDRAGSQRLGSLILAHAPTSMRNQRQKWYEVRLNVAQGLRSHRYEKEPTTKHNKNNVIRKKRH